MLHRTEADADGAVARASQRPRHGDGKTAKRRDTALDCLPPSLLQVNVLGFLSTPVAAPREDDFRPRRLRRELAPLRLVSRQWLQLTQRVEEDACRQPMQIALKTVDEWTRLLTLVRADGNRATRLRIIMGMAGGQFIDDIILCPYDTLDIAAARSLPWGELLVHFGGVQRLDLSMLAPECVAPVLAAAASMCPSVETLILPYRPSRHSNRIERFVTPLIEVLKSWHRANGGLKLLDVPWLPREGHQRLDEIVIAITEFCPAIHSIRGWHLGSWSGDVERLFDVGGNGWSRFCDSATELRESDWCVAPLTQQSVIAFGATVKPHLHTVIIHDHQKRFMDEVKTLATLKPMFAALPGLRSFRFAWYEDDDDDIEVAGGVVTIDELIVHMVEQCPSLKSVKYDVRSPLGDGAEVTGVGLLALARSPLIDDVIIVPARLDKNDLKDMVEAVLARGLREASFRVSTIGSAHIAIVYLINLLASHEPEDLVKGGSLHLTVESLQRDAADLVGENERMYIGQDRLMGITRFLNKRFRRSSVQLKVTTNYYEDEEGGFLAWDRHVLYGLELEINTPSSRPRRGLNQVTTDERYCGAVPTPSS